MSHSDRPSVAVAFHSGYGHTAVIAEAVARGAVEAGVEVISIPVDTITEEHWAQLDAADAITFGAPTYMGTAFAAFHAPSWALARRARPTPPRGRPSRTSPPRSTWAPVSPARPPPSFTPPGQRSPPESEPDSEPASEPAQNLAFRFRDAISRTPTP
ncbi:flavodoxin domain-containing protein [Streptomyces mirabilis]|uniref:flavodoxin family protein n=1 Tax=Streptomyces mirabilis TaxID=68239 RepID=UPI003F4E41A8